MTTIFVRREIKPPTLTPILICVIVVSIVGTMAILTLILSRIMKRRQRQHQQGEDEEVLHEKSRIVKSEKGKKKKMADLDRIEEEELQRQVMIRKSLASRTSCKSLSQASQTSDENGDLEENAQGLKKDWKEWEASIHHHRSVSTESHPGLKPDFSGASPLSLPPPSRAASPVKHTLLASNHRSSSPLPSSRHSLDPTLDGASPEDLRELRKNIQQQILRKNSERQA